MSGGYYTTSMASTRTVLDTFLMAICLLLTVTVPVHTTDVHYKLEGRLQLALFEDYFPYVRPVLSHDTPVKVKVFPTLIRIEQIDEKADILSTIVSLSMEWKDPRLSWNPTNYGNITYTYVPLDKLWSPDISLQNAAPELEDKSGRNLARVSYIGTVLITSFRQLHSYCAFDLTDFPMDIQTCSLKFGSWMYSAEQLLLSFWSPDRKQITVKLLSDRTDGDPSTDSQYWALVGRTADAVIDRVDYGSPYDVLRMTLRIQRVSNDMLVLATPLLITSLLVPVQFLIPTTSKQRSIFGVVVFVNLIALLQTVFVFIPSGHATVPRIAIWYIGNMGCSVLGVVLATITTIISNRRSSMPSAAVRNFTLRAKKIMCMSDTPHADDGQPDQVALLENGNSKGGSGSTEKPDHSAMTKLESIMMSKQNKKHKADEICRHWKEFSFALDRLFFYLFCLLFVVNLFIFV